jgi:hypothetical protein
VFRLLQTTTPKALSHFRTGPRRAPTQRAKALRSQVTVGVVVPAAAQMPLTMGCCCHYPKFPRRRTRSCRASTLDRSRLSTRIQTGLGTVLLAWNGQARVGSVFTGSRGGRRRVGNAWRGGSRYCVDFACVSSPDEQLSLARSFGYGARCANGRRGVTGCRGGI